MEKITIRDLDASDLFRFYDAREKILTYPNGDLKLYRRYNKTGTTVQTKLYYPTGKIGILCKFYKNHGVFGKQYVLQTWYKSGKKQLEATSSTRECIEWYVLYYENGKKKEVCAYDNFIRRWDEQGNTIECKYRPNDKWIDIVEICRKNSVSFAKMDVFIDTIIRDLRARGMMPPWDYDFSFMQRQAMVSCLAYKNANNCK